MHPVGLLPRAMPLLLRTWPCRGRLVHQSPSREWRIWNKLEWKDEADKVKVARFLQELIEEGKKRIPDEIHAPETDSFATITSGLDLLSVEGSDATLHLPPVLTHDVVVDLLQFFRTGGLLHKKYLKQILRQAYPLLEQSPSVVTVPQPGAHHRIVVVGDLHGSLEDLATIFELVGFPGPQLTMIFNGDFVDRGSNGVEVLLMLLALKVVHPNNVHLNRGNHEDKFIASAYDFLHEVLSKYKSEKVFDSFTLLFAQLPYAVLIPNHSFVVHGGLSRQDFSVDTLAALSRSQPILTVTALGSDTDPTLSLLQDLVWSDPREGRPGTTPNTTRNAGCFFGMDTADRWLTRHGLRYLIRSHECVMEGCRRQPAGLGTAVYTVFSASHYPNHQGANLGAVLRLNDMVSEPEVVTFSARRLEGEDECGEDAAKQTLVELICRHKHTLRHAFQNASDNELVTIDQWVAIMQAELGLDLDWRALQPLLGGAIGRYDAKLRRMIPTNLVNWQQFLSAFQVEFKRGGGKSAITGTVVNALYTNQSQLALLFRFMDADRSGTLTRDEFRAGCELLNTKIPEDERLNADELFTMMDFDRSGEVNLNEFCEAFRISHTARSVIEPAPAA